MRLIDADECEKYFYNHMTGAAMAGAMNAIDEMPTIEPCEHCVSIDAVLQTLYDYGCESEIQDAIAELPPVTPKQRWIPVSERLPESSGVYNVTRIIDEKRISDSCYYDGGGVWYDNNRINHGRKYLDDVIAWMPLPTPYKTESSKTEQGLAHADQEAMMPAT